MQYRATRLTFACSDEKFIREQIDGRRFKLPAESGFDCAFSKDDVYFFAVFNEHVDSVVRSIEIRLGHNLVSKEPVFRKQDYVNVVPRSTYHVNTSVRYFESTIQGYIEDYDLDLNPDFQRGEVWEDSDKREYIEYLLTGCTSGLDLYFNQPRNGRMVVVDGKQRINALISFVRDEFTILDGFRFSDIKKAFNDIYLSVNISNIENYNDVVRWYVALNGTGKRHTDEDINKAKRLIDA